MADAAARAGSFVRRHADFSGIGGAARRLPPLWQGEAATARLLADNPLYTKRFAYFVGRRCRGATIKDLAEELKLDWHTVKTLDQQYMEAQLERAGRLGPQVIRVDEIAIRAQRILPSMPS